MNHLGHRYCSSRDMEFLVCHMTKQDHLIKGSGDYNNKEPLTEHCHYAKFGDHTHCSGGNVILLDHVI